MIHHEDNKLDNPDDLSMNYEVFYSWLTPEQGAEWKAAMDAGDEEEIKKAYEKVDAIYDALDEGFEKEYGMGHLRGGCTHFFGLEIGWTQFTEFKQLQESGASLDEINAHIAELLSKITNEKKKARAKRITGNCKKIFAESYELANRPNPYEEYQLYFSWFTHRQEYDVKALMNAGKYQEAIDKTLEFYSALEGFYKTLATKKIKGGCKHYFMEAFGVEEAKAMKDFDSSMDEIGKKVDEFISTIRDDKEKEVANRVLATCKKIFSAPATMDEAMTSVGSILDGLNMIIYLPFHRLT